MEIIVITGLSGAGKSQALNTLEDLGYFSMDNLPPSLIPKFVETYSSYDYIEKVCVVVDVRSGKFFDDFSSSLKELDDLKINYKVLFLDADKSTIINRYKELRRPHPLNESIVKGYEMDKDLLKDIRKKADLIINTSKTTVSELKDKIIAFLDLDKEDNLIISLNSFGFKYGILLDGDLVFDVRFLPNPYYIKELKEFNGESEKVRDYVLNFDITEEFINKCVDMLKFLIPNYVKEGKSIIVIGFGCTGGFHRSVAITNEIGRRLKKIGYNIKINHRDVNKK